MIADITIADTMATVKSYLTAGLSVIRVRATGDERAKAPLDDGWYPTYAERHPTNQEVWLWFGPDAGRRYGIGIPCGAASGNLAVLDFETAAVYEAWRKALPADTTDYFDACPVVRTPGGGSHVYCRLLEPFRGFVLARRWLAAENRPATLVEVRGDGHQVVAPGGPLKSHHTGKPYTWERLGWIDEPFTGPLPWTVWVDWLDLAASLNEYTTPAAVRPAPAERQTTPSDDDPGRDFNRRATWEETGLFDAGWTWALEYDADRGTVTRPGKARGVSGTLGLRSSQANGWPLFHVFTSSAAVFDADANYDRFGVYCRLRHGGDFAAAARALLDKGYGVRRQVTPRATIGPQPGGVDDNSRPSPEVVHPPTAGGTGPKSKFKFEGLRALFARDSRPSWLIDRTLARRQPFVVAAPLKGMKTSVLLDMAVSLATATPFLGRFAVPRQTRVAVVSGESGEFTVKETLARVALARGITDLAAAAEGWLHVEFALPTLTDAVTMSDFAGHLARLEVDVVVIDPLYLCLGDADAKNMFEMGAALAGVATWLSAARPDLTVGLVHHANKSVQAGEPMELENIAYPALAQWARQFILLSRRTPYTNDGNHDMWLRVGGSIGTGGLYALKIAEGLIQSDFTGRFWNVEVLGLEAAKQAAKTDKAAEKRDLKLTELRENERAVLQAIDAECVAKRQPATLQRIRDLTGYTFVRATDTLRRLTEADAVVEVEFVKGAGKNARHNVKGFSRIGGD